MLLTTSKRDGTVSTPRSASPSMTTAHLSLIRQGLEDLSLSFLVLLENLALVERAVFPLREVFAYQRSVPQPPGPASPTSTGSPNRGHAVTRCAVNPPHDPQKVRMSPVSGADDEA